MLRVTVLLLLTVVASTLEAPIDATASTGEWGVASRALHATLEQFGEQAIEIAAATVLIADAAEMIQDVDRQSSGAIEEAEETITTPAHEKQDESAMQGVDRRSHPRLRA